MDKITNNRFIDQNPIGLQSTRLILGTIHPHDHEVFDVGFFYGYLSAGKRKAGKNKTGRREDYGPICITTMNRLLRRTLVRPVMLFGIVQIAFNKKISVSNNDSLKNRALFLA